MSGQWIDEGNHARLAELGQRILDGGQIDRTEALSLFNLEGAADIFDLLSWANRIREQFKGNKIHLCSIVNAKAGACSENCSFCAQSSFYQTGSPKYGFIEPEPVIEAADEANKNGVTAVGLVAAWKGLNEGPMLDEVCDRIRELARRQDAPRRLARHHQETGSRRPPEGSRAGMLRPQSRKLAPLFPEPLHHAHVRRPARNHRLSEKGRHQDLFRRHHRHGRNARRPLRPGVCIEGSRRERRARQYSQSDSRHAV